MSKMSRRLFRTPIVTAASLFFLAASLLAWPAAVSAAAIGGVPGIETEAKQAIIVDFDTGAVLLEKNADQEMTPSSMSKLMTVYLVFDRLKQGSLKESDKFVVSETAWKKNYKSGGSLMFLPVGARVSVGDLLRGVIVQSGNDACSVLAEGIAGSEDAFAALENKKAAEIGLTHSTFKNASGWPEPGHEMTARDLATLARRLILDFPEYYPIFKDIDFTYNGIKQGNRNPLLYANLGADGLKTGHTEAGGYGLTGSAVRDGRRIIIVLNGLPTMRSRSEESARLLEWAFHSFEDVRLVKAGDAVGNAPVAMGTATVVPAVADREVEATIPSGTRKEVSTTATYLSPLPAPVKKGQRVGTLTVTAPGQTPIAVPLVAGADVARLNWLGRFGVTLQNLLRGH